MRARHFGAVAGVVLASVLAGGQAMAVECSAVQPFINEVDYDHDQNVLFNIDRDEFVEIAAPAGTDLTGYRIVVIEGSNALCLTGGGGVSAGNAYIDEPLTGPAALVSDENGLGIGFVSVCFTSTSANVTQCDITVQGVANDSNLKNGSLTNPAGNCPDGVLLLDPLGNMVDAVAWEGQIPNEGAYGQFFQPGVTDYNLFPPVYDNGFDDHKSVARSDSSPARANSVSQWVVTAVGGATPSAENAGQALACTTGAAVCGDGFLGAGEECDDGNIDSGDGCSDMCIVEVCGDGVVQPGLGEQCDDGNDVLLDGCDNGCQIETNLCGNALVEFGEDCDDGNLVDGDGCSSLCTDEPTGVCGDGIVHPTEGCDDGNFVIGDGCDDGCSVEPTGVCGDGVVHPTEECDDGANGDVFDGCLDSCLLSNAVPATSPVGVAALLLTMMGMGVLMLLGLRRSEA